MKIERFNITRVVTRNFISDGWQGIRNSFGLRLRGYEKMITKTCNELILQMELDYDDILWWKLSINPLGDKSCMITIYGDAKQKR